MTKVVTEEEITKQNNPSISLYDFNKMLMAQLPELAKEDLEKCKENIKKYLSEKTNNYFMLLCSDLKYYTIFEIDNNNNEFMYDIVIECLENLGTIKSIEETGDGAIECWIQKDEEPYVAYLFPYDEGVIKCRK